MIDRKQRSFCLDHDDKENRGQFRVGKPKRSKTRSVSSQEAASQKSFIQGHRRIVGLDICQLLILASDLSTAAMLLNRRPKLRESRRVAGEKTRNEQISAMVSSLDDHVECLKLVSRSASAGEAISRIVDELAEVQEALIQAMRDCEQASDLSDDLSVRFDCELPVMARNCYEPNAIADGGKRDKHAAKSEIITLGSQFSSHNIAANKSETCYVLKSKADVSSKSLRN